MRGVRYRAASSVGTVVLTLLVLSVVNTDPVQDVVGRWVPVVDKLTPAVLSFDQLLLPFATAITVVVASMAPLFKPQPRRALDTLLAVQRRVVFAGFVLASVSYLDATFRLPRSTLVATTAALVVVLPAWFLLISQRPPDSPGRTVVVGNDPPEVARVLTQLDVPVYGYVSPPPTRVGDGGFAKLSSADAIEDVQADVLESVEYLGGLSHIRELLVEHDIDTVVSAFTYTDRSEFFGVLSICHDLGVAARVHREVASSVLVSAAGDSDLVEVDLEPWDWQDRVVKRLFDVAFAAAGLLVALPLMALVAVAIKLNDGGPVLYSQERTAEFGETFTIRKFRTMHPDAETEAVLSEDDTGGEDPRVTDLGRILRETHVDELPQLWSILVGDMTVVGPRPERPELEDRFEERIHQWRRRWFVKPGLTGLAQVEGLTGHEPAEKLRYDVEYIRRQSFRFDLAIVVRQLWQVLVKLWELR